MKTLAGILNFSDASASSVMDSLARRLKDEMADSVRVDVLSSLFQGYEFSDRTKAGSYAQTMLELSIRTGNKKGIIKAQNYFGYLADDAGRYEEALTHYTKALESSDIYGERRLQAHTLGNMGIVHRNQGNYYQALVLDKKSLQLFHNLGDSAGIALLNGNIGIVYQDQGMYPEALKHEFLALKMDEALGNGVSVARHLGNIGNIYKQSGDLHKALEFYLQADAKNKELDSKVPESTTLANIGLVYFELGDSAKAIEYYDKALAIAESIGYKTLIANTLGNKGNVFKNLKLYKKALSYYSRALAISEEIGDRRGIAVKTGNIGTLYFEQGDIATAVDYLEKARNMASEIKALDLEKDWCLHLSTVYAAARDYQKANDSYKRYSTINDSLFSEEKSKDMGRMEARYEFEKEEAQRLHDEEEQRKMLTEAKQRREKLQYSVVAIVLAALFLSMIWAGLNIPGRLAEGFVFLVFLLFFEFVLVLLDPLIERISAGEPVIILGFNAVLAAMIFPLHAFFERSVKMRFLKSKL